MFINLNAQYFLMKNIFSILFFVLLFSISFAAIPNYSDFYVNDFADVLSIEQENELTAILSAIPVDTTAEVVVVTVNSLEGYSPIEYATKIGQDWGVGKKETDNGLVILYAKTENKISVAVGYGLEGILPDSKVGRILDEQYVPLRDQGNVSQGIINATKVYAEELYKNKEEIGSTATQNPNDTIAWVFFGIFILFILIFVMSIIFSFSKGLKKSKDSKKIIGGTVIGIILILVSFFLSSPISTIFFIIGIFLAIGVNGGFRGGHGGSSWGGGHGGGFSGGGGSFGGGSFGGGGASR